MWHVLLGAAACATVFWIIAFRGGSPVVGEAPQTLTCEEENFVLAIEDGDLYEVYRRLDEGMDLEHVRQSSLNAIVAFGRLQSEAGPASPLVVFWDDLAARLITDGADPSESLQIARDSRSVSFLLSRGANVEAVDPFGATALIRCSSQQGDVAELLIDSGAEVDAADREGNTALHRAAADNATEVMRQLLLAHASTTRQNAWGQTPLTVARQRNNIEAVAMLEAWADYQGH